MNKWIRLPLLLINFKDRGMKSLLRIIECTSFFFLFFIVFSVSSFAQTPGLIVRPAGGKGPLTLNPNQDYFTSASSSGYTTNDITQSEILYKIIKPIVAEPTGDLATGPSGGYSDIVKTVDNSGCYIFNDGTNLLFRLRIGGIVSGAKAYNILIDTDGKMGATGPAADPNYVAPTNSGNGNPGFELEVALETGTNGRVAIYNVDGIVNPSASPTYSLATNSLISVALSRDGGDADYFYDFFVPLSALGISASTPIRIVISTNTNPGSAFQGTRSDIYGINDTNFSSTTDAWEYAAENTPSFTLNDVAAAGSGPGAVCTTAPVVNTGIAAGTNIAITGTWTKLDASNPSPATITVYKNGSFEGTTTCNSGSTWTYTIASVATGDIITAKAQASGESMCLVSNSVAVVSCIPSSTSSTSSAAFGTCVNNRRGMAGTRAANAAIKIYSISFGGSPVLVATETTPGPSPNFITYSTTTAWEYNGTNNSGSADPCSGGPNDIADGSYYITVTEVGKCESAPIWGSCVNLTQTTAPTITQTTVYSGSNTISGTNSSASAVTVRLFVNGFLVASTAAAGNGAYSFANVAVQAGDVITVRSQAASQCISNAATITATCFTSAPVITTDVQGNLTAGATTVTGTSSEPAGTTIRVYNASNVLQGSSTVQANGTWSVTVSALVNATGYYATAQNGTCSVSANSALATAKAATTVCPTITGAPYNETATSVSGSMPSSFTGTIYLYQDGAQIGSVSITNATSWTIPVAASNPLYAGGILTVGAQASNSTLNKSCASTTTVTCSAPASPAVTPVTSTISVGQSVTYSISGTQSGVLYIVEDASNGSSLATSQFGSGSAETFTTSVFTTPGTYNVNVTADKLSGSACKTTASASITVLGSSLPVELLGFNGKWINSRTVLTWKTGSEINADYFLIERSKDGRIFLPIGTTNAAGNSSYENSYQFTDQTPLSGANYYRLKMVDKDAKYQYSQVLQLYQNSVTGLLAMPNPFLSEINIQIRLDKKEEGYIRIIGENGKVVYNSYRLLEGGTNAIQVNGLSHLSAGTYLLEIRFGNLKTIQKIIKAN